MYVSSRKIFSYAFKKSIYEIRKPTFNAKNFLKFTVSTLGFGYWMCYNNKVNFHFYCICRKLIIAE